MSLGWPGNALGSPGGAGGGVWGERRLGVSAESAAPATRSQIKRKMTSTPTPTPTHSGNKPVILVVMHHTFNPNLVIAGSRNQVQDLNVHLTVDYCFFEHELLNCNRNKISWHEIQKFLTVSISRAWLQTLIEGVKENALIVTLFIVYVACITFVVTCIVLAEKGH
ncbi:hypothetical protein CHARACLAT_019415 [Characodon lateralis]|uniref:Uncharacterized protein n=1 Tax=Characodon lateralis TaxID=208331 RepID=A0ABU7DI11_9TELE|nr:hypothetical protein [Characodon lateralis]